MNRSADRSVRTARHALTGGEDRIAAARDFACDFLDRSIPPVPAVLLSDAVLAVSELVTNAVLHAPGPCTLTLADDGRDVTITVDDTSTRPLTARTADMSGGTGGFGWHLLHRISPNLTIEPIPGGKRISLRLRRTAAPTGEPLPGPRRNG
jgi:anti-sigma regulatory factor (Ser/Thr protein kinase)